MTIPLNYYSIVHGVNALLALCIIILILIKRAHQPIHRTFALYCVALFGWAFFYFMWGVQTELRPALFWLKALLYPTSFIHAAHLHFALVFSGTVSKYKKLLWVAYGLGAVLAALIFLTGPWTSPT